MEKWNDGMPNGIQLRSNGIFRIHPPESSLSKKKREDLRSNSRRKKEFEYFVVVNQDKSQNLLFLLCTEVSGEICRIVHSVRKNLLRLKIGIPLVITGESTHNFSCGCWASSKKVRPVYSFTLLRRIFPRVSKPLKRLRSGVVVLITQS